MAGHFGYVVENPEKKNNRVANRTGLKIGSTLAAD
jgi:hypothetical protein